MLDLLSGGGIGLNATAYMLGNLVAVGFDRIPIPSRAFRTTNWVAITTAVALKPHMERVAYFAGMGHDPLLSDAGIETVDMRQTWFYDHKSLGGKTTSHNQSRRACFGLDVILRNDL